MQIVNPIDGAEVRATLIASGAIIPFDQPRRTVRNVVAVPVDDDTFRSVAREILNSHSRARCAELAGDPDTDPRLASAIIALLGARQ